MKKLAKSPTNLTHPTHLNNEANRALSPSLQEHNEGAQVAQASKMSRLNNEANRALSPSLQEHNKRAQVAQASKMSRLSPAGLVSVMPPRVKCNSFLLMILVF